MSEQKPSAGRTVHYLDDGTPYLVVKDDDIEGVFTLGARVDLSPRGRLWHLYQYPDTASAFGDALDDYAHELAEQQRQQKTRLVELLRNMDRTQRETDEDGGRKFAWYYCREEIEDALGLGRGGLDTTEETTA